MTTFTEDCSHSDPSRPDATADFLRRLPASDEVVWTDGSVSPLGARDTSVQVACRRCLSSLHCPTRLAKSSL